jgi:hypothetical protein
MSGVTQNRPLRVEIKRFKTGLFGTEKLRWTAEMQDQWGMST